MYVRKKFSWLSETSYLNYQNSSTSSQSHIALYQANFTICTDGSAAEGTRNGGTAVVITRRPPTQFEVLTIIKTKSRTFTSSYVEEAVAMESTLTWISTTANHPSTTILICTDSKSLCETLLSSNPRMSFIYESINSISSSIEIQWIPRHSDIPGNELVNKAAKEATTMATNQIYRPNHSIMSSRRTRFNTLALRLSSKWRHKTMSVWARRVPCSGLPLNLGLWWCTQGRPWSTLTLNQNTHTHVSINLIILPAVLVKIHKKIFQ